MAYTVNGKGPYPDKAGEFCGNHDPAGPADSDYLKRMRFGKPSCCDDGTSREMAAGGWVGLYLKEDRKLFEWETPIETDALTEAVVSGEDEATEEETNSPTLD